MTTALEIYHNFASSFHNLPEMEVGKKCDLNSEEVTMEVGKLTKKASGLIPPSTLLSICPQEGPPKQKDRS